MNTVTQSLAAACCSLALAAAAQASPSADEVRNVLSYYYDGQQSTPVLVEFKLCEDVHRDGPDKNNCKNPIDPHSLEIGENVYAWMNFMVPREQRGEVLLQLRHNGVIRGARKAPVHGAIRYRTWRRLQFNRSGEWQLPILYENAGVVSQIETVSLTVNDPLVSQAYAPAELD